MESIFVTGLCTLHWGRLQYGNIGNYYIIEPLFRELHKYFPKHRIVTTFQMDDEFINKEDVEVLPMDLYYSWNPESDVAEAKMEVQMAEKFMQGEPCNMTPYIRALIQCEYVINVSGDMWGDNAEHVGADRFLVDCLKMQTAQLLNKKTVLFAVTPGPFSRNTELARKVFCQFDLVVIREKISEVNLKNWGFPVENVIYAPCPSFLFEPNKQYNSKWIEKLEAAKKKGRSVIGITFGGFNMPVGPYDMWPRDAKQYDVFLTLADFIINDLKAELFIFSHTNGFDLPPDFKLKNGRDFVILEQFHQIILEKNKANKEQVVLIDEPLLPCNIKAVIGKFDMLITGRVHASVASTSQCVPTVYMEYDRNVIYSDKMLGFSEQLGMERFVLEPGNPDMLLQKTAECYKNLESIRNELEQIVPKVQNMADSIFAEICKL